MKDHRNTPEACAIPLDGGWLVRRVYTHNVYQDTWLAEDPNGSFVYLNGTWQHQSALAAIQAVRHAQQLRRY